jgi:hypothetical protein
MVPVGSAIGWRCGVSTTSFTTVRAVKRFQADIQAPTHRARGADGGARGDSLSGLWADDARDMQPTRSEHPLHVTCPQCGSGAATGPAPAPHDCPGCLKIRGWRSLKPEAGEGQHRCRHLTHLGHHPRHRTVRRVQWPLPRLWPWGIGVLGIVVLIIVIVLLLTGLGGALVRFPCRRNGSAG